MSIYHCSTKKEDCHPMWVRKLTFWVCMGGVFNQGVGLSERIIDTPDALTSIIIGILVAYGTCDLWCIITNKEKLFD